MPNLPLWLGSPVSSVQYQSRFCLHHISHLSWSCPRRNPQRSCTSARTSLSTGSAPFYYCEGHNKNVGEMVHDVSGKPDIQKKWCAWWSYWLREAVGSSDDPAGRHQWTATCMLAILLQADLPGPVFDVSICTPDDPVLSAHLSTIC